MPFTLIGTDGGYLKSNVTLTESALLRVSVPIYWSTSRSCQSGQRLSLPTPQRPRHQGALPLTRQQPGRSCSLLSLQPPGHPRLSFPALPAALNPATLPGATFPTLTAPTKTRILTLQEVMGPLGPVEILLDGQKWAAPLSELPAQGTTEDWVIVNPTADTHPIHLHLIQFQTRQPATIPGKEIPDRLDCP